MPLFHRISANTLPTVKLSWKEPKKALITQINVSNHLLNQAEKRTLACFFEGM